MLDINVHRYLKADKKKDLSVLLIDDEENILNALVRELGDWARDNRLGLVTARCGQEAFEYLGRTTDTVAIVVSDMKMPGQHGSELVNALHDLVPDASLILLTGYPEVDEMMKIMKTGITSYILKPWESDLLIREATLALRAFRAREENLLWKKIIEDELVFAGRMQEKLMGRRIENTLRFSFGVLYEPLPVFRSSGDYYDVFDLGRERYLILIGEVKAHKLKSAIITGILKATIFSEYVKIHRQDDVFPVSAFLSWLEKNILEICRPSSRLAVSFSAVAVDLESMRLVYANAGNPPFYLVRDSRCTRLHLDEPPLGINGERRLPTGTLELKPRDSLLFSTDGLMEQFDSAGGKSGERFLRALSSACESGNFQDAFLNICRKLILEEEMRDDMTVLVAEIS